MTIKQKKMPKTVKKAETAYASLVYNKQMPQAIEMEEAVLGAFMIDRDTHYLLHRLTVDAFYDTRNQIVFEAILNINEKSKIDILTVTEECRKMGKLEEAGGPYYIVDLTSRVASAAHIEHHIMILLEKQMRRRQIKAGVELVAKAFTDETDPLEDNEEAMKMLESTIMESGNTMSIVSISDVVTEVVRNNFNPPDEPPTIQIKVPNIDKYDSGGKGEVTIVAGRPGMGKSTYALWEARKTAEAGHPVLFMNLETPNRAMAARMLARSGMKYRDIKNFRVQGEDFQILTKEAAEIQKLPIYTTDVTMDLRKIKANIAFAIRRLGVERVYIDQISHVDEQGKDEYSILTNVIKGITRTAKDFDIPITALAQLNRKVEERPMNTLWRPRISDLKQTGRIEEDATTIILLWRPQYYFEKGIAKFERVKTLSGEEISSKGYLEAMFAKTRNDSPGMEPFTFDAPRFDLIPFRELQYTSDDTKYIDFQKDDDDGLAF